MTTELRRLAAIARRIDTNLAERDQLIVAARHTGATWPQIAHAAHLSRASAINHYRTASERTDHADHDSH